MARIRQNSESNVVFICTNKCCAIFVLIVGICLTAGGIIGLIISPIVSKMQVEQQIPLTEHSFAASQWMDPPFTITMQLWLFNTTNPDAILRGYYKPSVSEKGPYTYKQKNQKNQVFYGDADNVFYEENNWFYFDKTRSCKDCLETDVFTVPNAVYTTVAQMLRFKDNDTKRIANMALLLLGERPFVTKTVSELLFKGFEDQLLIVANALSRFLPEIEDVHLPKVFSYFPKNNTNDGTYEVRVGKDDVTKMGSILSWNGKNTLDWYNTTEANEIKGTDAQMFPPYIARDHKLPIFVSDMCRSSYLKYKADTFTEGLQTYRFIIPPEAFDMTLEENKGFCFPTPDIYFPSQAPIYNCSEYNTTTYNSSSEMDDNFYDMNNNGSTFENCTLIYNGSECIPHGFMNLSACRAGSPILLSLPHFLYASDDVIDSIDGIHPTADHEATWDIQPQFGAAVSVNTKFQINVPIFNDSKLWSIKQVKPTVIPLFWFNASAHADPGTRQYLHTNIVVLQTVGYAATFAVFGFGMLFLLTLIGCFCRYRMKAKAAWSLTISEANNSHVNRALIEETDGMPNGNWSTRKI